MFYANCYYSNRDTSKPLILVLTYPTDLVFVFSYTCNQLNVHLVSLHLVSSHSLVFFHQLFLPLCYFYNRIPNPYPNFTLNLQNLSHMVFSPRISYPRLRGCGSDYPYYQNRQHECRYLNNRNAKRLLKKKRKRSDSVL